jgi:hypothetical protein
MMHPEAIKISFRHLETLIKKQEDIIQALVEKTQSTEEVAKLRRKHQQATEKEIDRGLFLELNFTEATVPQLHPVVICRCLRHLENLIQKQEDVIETVIKKTKSIDDVVYQLISGLFNQTTQAQIIHKHIKTLNKVDLQDREAREASSDQDDEDSSEDSDCDQDDEDSSEDNDCDQERIRETQTLQNTSEWDIWATTRQGDQNQLKIERLEAEILAMKAQNHALNTQVETLNAQFHSFKSALLVKPTLTRSNLQTHHEIDLDRLALPDKDKDKDKDPCFKILFSKHFCGNE